MPTPPTLLRPFIFLLFLTTLFPLHTSAFTFHPSCNTPKLTHILVEAQTLARAGYDAVRSSSPLKWTVRQHSLNLPAIFSSYFPDTPKARKHVEDVFRIIATTDFTSSNAGLHIRCTESPLWIHEHMCDRDIGYSYREADATYGHNGIVLCPRVLKSPYHSALTLLHEFTHSNLLYAAGKRTVDVELKSGLGAYTPPRCKQLRRENPQATLRNADSYKNFAAEADAVLNPGRAQPGRVW